MVRGLCLKALYSCLRVYLATVRPLEYFPQGNGREDAKKDALSSVVVGGAIVPSRSGSHFSRGCTQYVVCIAFEVSTWHRRAYF